jgi:hypothetical protein
VITRERERERERARERARERGSDERALVKGGVKAHDAAGGVGGDFALGRACFVGCEA